MPAVSLIDPPAERVGALVRDAFVDVLGDRIDALLVHGSAVTGGYIEGYSDFDLVIFVRGGLTPADALAVQHRLGDVDHSPFAYLQASRVIDLDAPPPEEQRRLLIDGAYAALVGQHPDGWPFHDAETLAERSHEILAALPTLFDRKSRHWAVATGPRRTLEVRYHMTDLKPALRAHLVALGEPVLEVWTAPYPELARRWTAHDPEFGERFSRLLGALPALPDREAEVGEEMLALLEVIGDAIR